MNQQSSVNSPIFKVVSFYFTLLILFIVVGCAPASEIATPTPTKTPLGGETANVATENTPIATTVSTSTGIVTGENVAGESITGESIPNEATVVEATSTPFAPAGTNTTVSVQVVPPTSTAVAIQPALIERAVNAAPYTGLTVSDPAALTRQPIMICVNNDTKGRSQHHGLSQADVIYEYLMDGYVTTRLTAIYHSREADHIGPVRSARFPNVWMGEMYGGLLACSGGSDAIRYLLAYEVSFYYLDGDLDDSGSNVYFFNVRDTATGDFDYRTRLRTSTAGVRKWAENKGYLQAWNRAGFVYSNERPNHPGELSEQLNITYPGGNSVRWVYSASKGGYLRYQGGEQQIDLANGQPIVAQNVIVMTTLHEVTDVVEDSLGTKGIDVKLYGINDVLIFRDGQVYGGTWQADATTPPRWIGFDGTPIPLKPGQSWVQAIRNSGEISY